MQTKRLITAFLACATLFIWSCGKDDPAVEESPFFSFFDEADIKIDTTPSAAVAWEYGFTFTTLQSGKVTEFGIKLPATGDFKVRFWDLSGATPVLIREKSVTSSAVHNPAFITVPDISVEKGKKYGVTVLADAFYRISKKSGDKFTFPIERDNIRIESFNEDPNDLGVEAFPLTTTEDHVAPCVNVIFIAD